MKTKKGISTRSHLRRPQPARRPSRTHAGVKRQEKATDRLYNAVAEYIKAHGGYAVLAAGVQIQQWPEARESEFIVAVKILGRKPTFAAAGVPEGRK